MRRCPMSQVRAGGRCALFFSMLAISVAQSSRGDLLVSDYKRGVLRYDEATGEYLGMLISRVSRSAPHSGLAGPVGLVYDHDGNLFVSDYVSDTVQRINKYHGVTGALLQQGFALGGPGLVDPRRMSFGPDGDLYVPWLQSDTVTRIDGDTGELVRTYTGMVGPTNLAIGPDGGLYVPSFSNPTVLRFDVDSGASMPFVTEPLNNFNPFGMTFGPDGNLYVGDDLTRSVRRFDGQTGAFLNHVVPPGALGLFNPSSIRFDRDGNMYVISQDQSIDDPGRVLRFAPNGDYLGDFVVVEPTSQILDMTFTPEFHIVDGDTDNDGDVDLDDLNYVRNNFGATTGPVLGDTTPFDGDVDLDDLNAVRNNFGAAPGAATVPEPRTLTLLTIGALMTVVRLQRVRAVILALLLAATMTASVTPALADLLVADPIQGVLRFDDTTGEYRGVMISTPNRAHPNGSVREAFGLVYGADNNLYVAEAAEYLSNNDGLNQVSKYHGVTGALLQRGFAKGGGLSDPRRMAIGLDGDLWVPSFSAGLVSRYDGATGALVENLQDPSLTGSRNVAFGPDGALYIANFSDPSVLRYDLETKQFSSFVTDAYDSLLPCGLTFGPDGNLYVGGIASNAVRRYDGATGASLGDFVASADHGLVEPLSVRFGPDDNLYVISNDENLPDVGKVLRFDPNGQFIDEFAAVPGVSDIRDIVFTPEFHIVDGDTDNDGDVDLNDLNYVRNNFGATLGPVVGDTMPFDGDVDLDDLNAVRNNFGAAPGSATVPEPGTYGLALVALLGGAWWRRRPCRSVE